MTQTLKSDLVQVPIHLLAGAKNSNPVVVSLITIALVVVAVVILVSKLRK